MARFERSRERKSRNDSRGSSPRRGPNDSRGSSPRRGSNDTRGGSPRRGSNDSRGSSPRRGSRDRMTFKDSPWGRGRRDSDREHKRYSTNRRDFKMTKVTCSSCGDECEVPFKPTSNKPVYCRNCFAKKDKVSSDKPSNRDIDIINEKLDKIINALDLK